MCSYKIEDLVGKYAKVGTSECDSLILACEEIGIKWASGDSAQAYKPESNFVVVWDNNTMSDQGSIDDYSFNHDEKAEPFITKPQWSPEANTLPTKDLSDEQYGKMRRLEDGVNEFMASNGGDFLVIGRKPDWNPKLVYRVNPKPKSEREVFVDGFMASASFFTDEEHIRRKFAGDVFDAIKNGDIKAPEVD